MNGLLFSGIQIGSLALRNRIVRSATYEGAADTDGAPGESYLRMYEQLGAMHIGLIITGFVYVSREGRAIQPLQAGMDSRENITAYRRVTDAVHRGGAPIIAQLAHTGRQTRRSVTGVRPFSSTRRRSLYFRERPRLLGRKDALEIALRFVRAATLAREAGFDGVQLHAAHGYLLHQLLLPDVNRLANEYGINRATGIGTELADRIIDSIREACGEDFPILVKISGETDYRRDFYPEHFDRFIEWLHGKRVAAIEISYGTMDYALNIFRGDVPVELALRHNPLFQTRSRLLRAGIEYYFRHKMLPVFIPFTPMYNLVYAARAKTLTDIPIITVGGARAKSEMEEAIALGKTDLVAMSRPFLREPDIVIRMEQAAGDYHSPCENCNHCVLMCDAGRLTKCYKRYPKSQEGLSS